MPLDQLVEAAQDQRRLALRLRQGGGACSRTVADQGGAHRSVHPLAADVAEHDPPLVAVGREDVVEVPTDLAAVARRTVGAREGEPRHRGKGARHQRPLQGVDEGAQTSLRVLGGPLGCARRLGGVDQVLLVTSPLRGVEDCDAHQAHPALRVPLRGGGEEDRHVGAVGTLEVDGHLVDGAIEAQGRHEEGLVEDPTGG